MPEWEEMICGMTFRTVLVVLGIAAILKAAGTLMIDTGEIRTMLVAGPSRLKSSFGPALSDEALDAYRSWSRKPAHFGAFAASEYGNFGWISNYNSIEAAEAAAIEICGMPDCRVFARSLPLVAPKEGELVVSRPAAEKFEEYLTLPGAKAYALHGNGAGGSWIGADSLGSAKVSALGECERRSKRPEGEALSADQTDTCRVVHAQR